MVIGGTTSRQVIKATRTPVDYVNGFFPRNGGCTSQYDRRRAMINPEGFEAIVRVVSEQQKNYRRALVEMGVEQTSS